MLFSQRQSTQIEELETLMGKLGPQSSRSRNTSTERSTHLQTENSRYRTKNIAQSYSVEKSLNLSTQNQRVESLIASWKQQKNNSTSLNTSSNNVMPVSQFESQGRSSNRPHIIIEEDAIFAEDTDQKAAPQSNRVQVKNKTPNSTRPHAKSIKEQTSFDAKKAVQIKKATPVNISTKLQPTKCTTQVKSSPLVIKEPQLPNTSKLNNNLVNRNRNNTTSYKQIVKKGSMHTEGYLDQACIDDLMKIKDQIISAYLKQNRALISSQNQIVKNFDQIVQILKQDFQQQ